MTNRITLTSIAFAAFLGGGVALGALGTGLTGIHQAEADPIIVQAPHGAPMSFADLIEQVSPAVVSVNVTTEREVGSLADLEQFFERFGGAPQEFEEFLERRREEGEDNDAPQTRESRALGSGFFISEEGYVVTNNHVVADATKIQVVLTDGRELEAELIGTDSQTDLAVLKVIDPGTYPYVEFAQGSNVRKGDWVVALGNPFGLGGTATAGIISADGRDLGPRSPYTDFLQIDASINRGNSGGPTFDLNGRVIGVNTAIFSPTGGSVGIGFAIPSDLAVQVTDQLIDNGTVSRGWLGVSIQDVTDDMAEALGVADASGAIVSDLVSGSPALKAGIERGDVILSINGTKVEDATQVTRVVGSLLAGSSNAFRVLRDGAERTVTVTVGERPENPLALPTSGNESEDTSDEEAGDKAELGVELMGLDAETREKLGLGDDDAGLLITDIDRSSVLRDAGIEPGMAILEVNGRSVSTAAQFDAAIEAARQSGKEQVLMAIRAGTRTIFSTADISSEEG